MLHNIQETPKKGNIQDKMNAQQLADKYMADAERFVLRGRYDLSAETLLKAAEPFIADGQHYRAVEVYELAADRFEYKHMPEKRDEAREKINELMQIKSIFEEKAQLEAERAEADRKLLEQIRLEEEEEDHEEALEEERIGQIRTKQLNALRAKRAALVLELEDVESQLATF